VHRYVHNANSGQQLECARLAALLLPAVFTCSLEHPQRAVDFAGYTPLELLGCGGALFDDPYRWGLGGLAAS
jgi:hypothetical protein